jgi:penicillin amidase
MQRIVKLLVVLLVLALGLGYYGVHKLRTGPGLPSGTLAIPGLQAPVEILYDSMGIPHLFAGSTADLFRAQGWIHAQDRLWQMEMFRRVQDGRLSEIFGPSMIETDRFLRTIGMGLAGARGLPAEGTPMRANTEHYAAGVNAALESWQGFLPPEFVLLRLKPEPWEPRLTQGIEKIMAWDLSDYQTGLSLAEARSILGDEKLLPLMPRYPDWGPTIVDGWPEGNLDARDAEAQSQDGAAAMTTAVATDTEDLLPPDLFPPAPAPSLVAQAKLAQDVASVLELGSVVRASNSWVVGGDRSRSGKPLVANDMHLALNAPNIWYLIGLHAPGYDVVGMSLPGAPGIVAGHSAAVAWGFTNAMVDDSDFFIEQVNPEDSTEYRTPDGWQPFETRVETILVRGREDVTMTVRSTRHGPVITPVEDRAQGRVLAFKWVAHEPAGTFEALLGMGRASSVEEFIQAMRPFGNPHQNVVFADTAGAWGYWMGGRVPVRASGTPPHLPVPGWTGESDWIGWVPFEEKPHVLAPDRGYIATANNAQGRDDAAKRVTDGRWFGPHRAYRISELIEATELHDAESLLAIQMDPGSSFVQQQIERAVQAFADAGLPSLADALRSWDGLADLESTEATLFHAWWTGVHRGFREAYYEGESGYFPSHYVEEVLTGTAKLPDGVHVPDSIMVHAAHAAADFADMPWGEAHQLDLDHLMSVVPVVGKLLRFGRYGIPRVGGPNSVNVAGFSGARPPFRTAYGPSQRHVVDLADPDGSGGFILPGGQSGYPASPHAFDQLELWRDGRLWLLPLQRDHVEARAVTRVRLEPGGP